MNPKNLLSRFIVSFNFSGNALEWVSSYLTGRIQQQLCSDKTPHTAGVPPGFPSDHCSFLFRSLQSVDVLHDLHKVSIQQYADDKPFL